MLPRALRVLVAVIGLLAPYNQGHLLAADDRAVVARAEDVRPLDIYHGAERPGYACWVSVWKDSDDAVYLSFSEKRSGHNDAWKPMPLDVWESMVLPRGYHTALGLGDKNIIYEFVILKSTDNGASWKEIGRSRSEDSDDTFSLATLADGRIVRTVGNDYLFWRRQGGKMLTWSEVSADGGHTWTKQGELFEGHNASGSPFRLRRLRDGTLAQLCTVEASFGPGQERIMRHAKRPYVRMEVMPSLFFSKDDGRSWSGPLPVLGGVHADEPDFLELPSGDLLILNSAVQQGPQVRQNVRNTRFGWFPGPVMDVISGRVPEAAVLTRAGLLVGAVRGGEYSCSNDEGATWHKIEGIPGCNYQPSITELADGRLLCAWHVGGDQPFGQSDQWVGAHVFRLTTRLPQPTRLVLERQLDAAGQRDVNIYRLTLTSGDAPVAGKAVSYSFDKRYGGGGKGTVTTDDQGTARIDLTAEFAGVTDPHLGYSLRAWFDPSPGDAELSACRCAEYYAYAITTTKEELGWK